MRSLTNTEIERIKVLTENSVDFCLIEPTKNGLSKSIMDATGVVRSYFKSNNVHDYGLQGQGPSNKVQINSVLVLADGVQNSIGSLYRPLTKLGDPRIWFSGLNTYASPSDILAIISLDDKLYVINITQLDLQKLYNSKLTNPLKELVNEINFISDEVTEELLNLLINISRLGPLPATVNADTAIGRTLEMHLGIDINSSKKPDYNGIEIKSFRDKRGIRKNLFTQVPDWHLSKFKSSSEILDNFGYKRGDDFKLKCTVSAQVRNSQGLKLWLDEGFTNLFENSNNESAPKR